MSAPKNIADIFDAVEALRLDVYQLRDLIVKAAENSTRLDGHQEQLKNVVEDVRQLQQLLFIESHEGGGVRVTTQTATESRSSWWPVLGIAAIVLALLWGFSQSKEPAVDRVEQIEQQQPRQPE